MSILDGKKLEDGVALALSGGGFRATLFHLGALIRLNELGILPKLKRISSVSGGSIAAGVLALRWPLLRFDDSGTATNFEAEVVSPLLNFTSRTIDLFAGALGVLPGVSPARILAWHYRKQLFQDATLHALPDAPRFIFCSVNLLSGGLWRFSKPYMADYRVGQLRKPKILLAEAVAASSAFPIGLSPLTLRFAPGEIEPLEGADLHRPPFTRRAIFTDGGVYENLGLEPVWKRYQTLLVSDAGGALPTFAAPFPGALSQIIRVAKVAHAQHGHLRSRVLIDLFMSGRRRGAYWGMTPFYRKFAVSDHPTLTANEDETADLFRVRLNRTSPDEQRLLMHAGYARCDAAIRSFYLPELTPPDSTSWWSRSRTASAAA